MTFNLFLICPLGVETLLRQELQALGLSDLRETVTGVFATASHQQIYEVCLWSRLANRVLLLLDEAKSGDADHIYHTVKQIHWEQHLPESAPLRVDFSGSNEHIRNTQYGAQVVKDGIVDRMQYCGLARPEVDLKQTKHRINVRLTKQKLYISLDLSGDSLHKRGYRQATGIAPLKENVAAALLLKAKWPEKAAKGQSLVDPMCGSATFLIEAAMMAADIAPALKREQFAFMHWLPFDNTLWQRVYQQAQTRAEQGLSSLTNTVIGYEKDPEVLQAAQYNINAAGLASHIDCMAGELTQPSDALIPGLLITNPPYGVRMNSEASLLPLYQALATTAKRHFPNWHLAVLSYHDSLFNALGLRADKKSRIYNGALECEFRLYRLLDRQRSESSNAADTLSEGAQMVANRLSKNIRKLAAWKKQHAVDCYRIYDADLPEYAAAIDVYGERLHIQEYKAPSTVDEKKAQQRFKDLVRAAQHVFQCSRAQISCKTRQRNRGAKQYEKHQDLNWDKAFTVQEGPARFWVDLESYLDTGLFLDHRLLRQQMYQQAKGKDILNLFCYTASASVHAALGGAKSTTSVDMSNTYTQWARRNFDENNIQSASHRIIRDDVFEWLKSCRQGFDLIFLDPPSFSNSKKMHASFDVQRDHRRMIHRCMDLLKSKGTLYFSNNLRQFSLDASLNDRFAVDNISARTIDRDFERNPKIHHSFKFEHKPL